MDTRTTTQGSPGEAVMNEPEERAEPPEMAAAFVRWEAFGDVGSHRPADAIYFKLGMLVQQGPLVLVMGKEGIRRLLANGIDLLA
jgi:hypothetical protein